MEWLSQITLLVSLCIIQQQLFCSADDVTLDAKWGIVIITFPLNSHATSFAQSQVVSRDCHWLAAILITHRYTNVIALWWQWKTSDGILCFLSRFQFSFLCYSNSFLYVTVIPSSDRRPKQWFYMVRSLLVSILAFISDPAACVPSFAQLLEHTHTHCVCMATSVFPFIVAIRSHELLEDKWANAQMDSCAERGQEVGFMQAARAFARIRKCYSHLEATFLGGGELYSLEWLDCPDNLEAVVGITVSPCPQSSDSTTV